MLHRSVEVAATSRHSVAQNRLPLYPRKRTFRGPRWTSVVDPQRKFPPLVHAGKSSPAQIAPSDRSGSQITPVGTTMPQTINAMPTTYVTFQMTEIAVLRDLFRCILELIGQSPTRAGGAILTAAAGRPSGPANRRRPSWLSISESGWCRTTGKLRCQGHRRPKKAAFVFSGTVNWDSIPQNLGGWTVHIGNVRFRYAFT